MHSEQEVKAAIENGLGRLDGREANEKLLFFTNSRASLDAFFVITLSKQTKNSQYNQYSHRIRGFDMKRKEFYGNKDGDSFNSFIACDTRFSANQVLNRIIMRLNYFR